MALLGEAGTSCFRPADTRPSCALLLVLLQVAGRHGSPRPWGGRARGCGPSLELQAAPFVHEATGESDGDRMAARRDNRVGALDDFMLMNYAANDVLVDSET